MIMKNKFKDIVKVIKKAKSIAIFTHVNPDPDALGSSISLSLALRSLNKNTQVFIKDKVTYNLSLLFDKNLYTDKDCNPNDFDLMISTDVPSKKRLGEYGEVFINFKNKIVLDHHYKDDLKSEYYYIDENSSSCSEISYLLMKALKIKITPLIATYVYTGISGDTGSFMNSNANVESFKTTCELIKLGADYVRVNEALYKTIGKTEMLFKQYLYSNYVIYKDCAYCLVDNETLNTLNGNKWHCDSFSSELLKIQDVSHSFSLVEIEKGLFALSLRGKNNVNVKDVASLLGGGGHLCAAGAKFTAKSMKEAKDRVLNAMFKE